MRLRIDKIARKLRSIATSVNNGSALVESLSTAQAELADRQRQLVTSEQRLSLALEATGDALFDYRRGERLYLSDSYYAMLGYTADDEAAQPSNWVELVHPDEAAATREAVHRVHVGTTDLLSAEFRIRTAGGAWKWVYLRARVVERSPDDNAPLRMIGTIQDVDRRRQADAALRESQELFRNAFEESAIGMALVLPDGRLMRANPPFCEILGYTADELAVMKFQDVTHPDDLHADVELLGRVLRGETRHYSMEKRYVRKDGNIVWALLDVGVVLDADGQPQYLISQVQNITQRKQNEADLRAFARRLMVAKDQLERSTTELVAKTAEAEAAKLVAEEAVRAKSAFLANISHEIRTPMAAIIGFANLLLDERLPPDERVRSTETIARQGQHLLGLINDILDLSKIEAGRMTVECIECDPARVLADVEAMTAAKALNKGLGLTTFVAPGVPQRVRTDPTRLRQILLNLVSNAIKFTHRGDIRVEMRPAVLSGDRAGLEIVVSDTGIGIDERQLSHIFEPFMQADDSTTRRFGGTGLGLAISKRLVEMLHGTLLVRSRLGEGSEFEVRVEAEECTPTAPPAQTPAPSLRPGLRVLLAEDGRDNQRLITFYLRHAGVEAEVAENGRIAVDRVLAARAEGRPFDLVLMDMQMPEMDGYAACLAIAEAGVSVPVLALTAYDTEDARAQSLRAGCLDHLIKPVDHDDLLRAIATYTATIPSAVELPDYDDYVAALPMTAGQILRLRDAGCLDSLRRLVTYVHQTAAGYGLATLSVAAGGVISTFGEDEVNSLPESVDELVTLMRSVQGYDRGRESLPCNSGC